MSTLKLRKFFAAFTLTTLIASLFVVAPVTQAAPPSWWTEGTELLDQVAAVYGDENQVEADKCRVAAVLTAALGLEEKPEAAASYTDVPAECAGVAGAMIAAGIIMGEGNDGKTFGSGVQINRAVFATMLSRAFNLDVEYPNATLSAAAAAELADAEWAKPSFAQVMAAGIYQQIRPSDTINIYEITTAVSRALNPAPAPQPGTGGELTVTISDNTPDSALVPGGVENAHVATFKLTAGSKDVNVTSVRFTRGGITAREALESIALFSQDGQRVSRARSFNTSDNQATVNLLGGGLNIPAGRSVELVVIGKIGDAGIAGVPNSQFFLEVNSSADVVSNSSAVTVRGARSNAMTVGSVNAVELQLSAGASSPRVSVGERGAKVYEFRMENRANNNTDVIFYGITLEAEGTFDEKKDLMNYQLYLDGKLVASTKEAVNGYVSFLVSDKEGVTIPRSRRVRAEVKADIMSGAGETIAFTVDEYLDVLAADASFGTGAVITGDISGNATDIEAGELTLVAVDTQNDEFTENTRDYVLGTIRVTSNSGENIELQQLAVQIQKPAGGNYANVSQVLENVEAVTPFGTYSLNRQGGAATTETYRDNRVDIMLPAGQSFDIVIRADILDNLPLLNSTDSLRMSLPTINGVKGVSFFYAEEINDRTAVTDITPSTLTFNELRGSSAELEARAITQSNRSVVVGSKNIAALHFELEAGRTEDIRVNDLTVAFPSGGGLTQGSNANISALRLYRGSVSAENLLSTKSGSRLSGGQVVFDNLNTIIEADKTVQFIVEIDLVDDQSLAGVQLRARLVDVDAQDEDNDDVNTNGLDVVSTRLITLQAAGTLNATADNTDPVSNRAKLVLAGETSDFVASFELNAQDEAFTIRDLNVIAGGGALSLENSVATMILFANDRVTEVSRRSVTGNTVEFRNLNYTVQQGSENLYVKVITHEFGKNKPGAESSFNGLGNNPSDYSLQLQITDVRSASTGRSITPPATTTPSNGFAVSAVKLNGLSFVDSYNGLSVGNQLVAGENRVAILKVDNAAHNNTDANDVRLRTLLNQLNFTLSENTTLVSANIERLDRNVDGKVSCTLNAPFVECGDDNNSSVDFELTQGETAYYGLNIVVSLSAPAGDEFLRASLENFRDATLTPAVVYSTTGGTTELVDVARIQQTRIESRQLNESN